MLTVQCPDCGYPDQGYDIDLIMAAYRKHKQECPKVWGTNSLKEKTR